MKAKLNKLENQLLKKYEVLYQKAKPEGVFNIAPAIPFVGNKLKSPRILVYASAENLTYLNNISSNKDGHMVLSLDEQDQHIRSRIFYNKYKGEAKPPYVHIQPINDGSLLSVTRYIVKKMGEEKAFSYDPYEFIESIAVANFGKFSIDSESNKDYARNFRRLKESLEYVQQDISIIQPEILIIPKTIYYTLKNKDEWKEIMAESGKSIKTVILVYQTNQRVINTHIARETKKKDFTKFRNMPEAKWTSVSGIEKYFCWLNMNWKDLRKERENAIDKITYN